MSDIPESNIRVSKLSGRTQVKIRKIEYTWTIDGFSLCQDDPGSAIESPKFSFGEYKPWLIAHPGGTSSYTKGFLTIGLQMTEPIDKNRLNYIISLINSEQKEVNSGPKTWYENNKANCCRFIKRDSILDATNGLLNGDKLTILLRAEVIEITTTDESAYQDNYPLLNVPEREVFDDFSKLFKTRELSDVVILANRRELKAHKLVLSARSPVFRAMFSTYMMEDDDNQVDLSNIDEDVVQEMLEFIYTGETPSLDIGGPDKTEKFLAGSLTTDSAIPIFIYAHRVDEGKLKDEALNFICAHANVIVGTAIWSTFMRENPGLASEVFKAMAK